MTTSEEHTAPAEALSGYLGGWTDTLDAEYRDSPKFFDRFLAMLDVPRSRDSLTPVEQALIGVAVVGNTASTNWPRLRAYVRVALRLGASRSEVRDVLQLVSIMSIHALSIGAPAVADVLRERGIGPSAELSARQQGLRADFEHNRGYWHKSWDDVLALDPDMFEAYTNFSTVGPQFGSLPVKLRELIYIAIDCVVTHLYVPGVQIHTRAALDAGATVDEILSAIEIAAFTGADPYFEAIARVPELFEGANEVVEHSQ
ncbi:carboxymuconolactone decarboxylase family protein [Rhodococcus sp. IEGM 1366]|uniref:carboxymuconolactone decarboxylase family protein n=1 Tax=Rhodococcus sp. IEGM 1366 TaxID=3082223 RepID=UPI002955D442|nr:carboxymuconolactone decarboxylase family protein [Rhodococcus sp. IEGM 1366]MDV8070606.1 carboxymuconolactone decarboxylase family protein [Rhodococcus sp. IEGM 1366]